MSDFLEQLKERRSIRAFQEKMVPKEDIEKVIEAGLYAASGKNRQDSIIVAVTDRECRDWFSRINAEIMGVSTDPFYGAPVILIVLADKNAPTYLYDGSLTIGNMLLEADALGLGACWIHRAKEEFESEEGQAFLKSLGIEGDYEGIGHVALGYPSMEKAAAPERKGGRVFWKA